MLIRTAAGLTGLLFYAGVVCSQGIWGAKATHVQFGVNLQQIAEQTLKSVANEALKNPSPSSTPSKSPGVPTPVHPSPGVAKNPFPYATTPSKQAPSSSRASKPTKATAGPTTRSAATVAAFPFETRTMTASPDIEPVVVPIYKDLPISGYNGVLGTAEARTLQEDLNRWLLLMDLAKRPGMLDSPDTALTIATLFLPIERWGDYFNCASPGSKLSCAQVLGRSRKNHRRPMDGWKGGNEFEKARSYKAFVQDYKPLLMDQAASLPQDIYLVTQAYFQQFSVEQGGFPLSWQNGLLGSGTSQNDGNVRGVPLAGPYAAPLFMNLPKVLPCEPEQCERLISVAPSRVVYALVKLHVTHVDSGSAIGMTMESRASGNGKSRAELASGVELYADKDLSQRVHTFEAPSQLAVAKSEGFGAAPVILNADTLSLLMLKYSSTGMQGPSMEEMYRSRNRSEASYYAMASNGQWPAYDPWGPYFPSARLQATALKEADVAEFAQWSTRRAATFPRALMMRFWLTSNLMQSEVGLITSKLDFGGQGVSGVTELYLSDKSGTVSQEPASVLDRSGVAAFSNVIGVRLATGTSVTAAAIVFPEPLQNYRMSGPIKTGAARQIDPVFSELELIIDSVRFWPEEAPKIMLVHVKPQHARIKKGSVVLAETPLQAAGAVVAESNGGFDILGVSLGMPVSDAEKLLREYLAPDNIEDHVAQDASLGYTKSRLFSSTQKNERVIVYASGDGKVAGIERVLGVKPEHRELVERGLIDKYGEPQKRAGSAYEWWPKRLADYCYKKQSQRHNSQSIEGVFKGRTSVGTQPLSIFSPHETRVSAEALSRCGPILSGDLSPALRLYLYDHRAYMQTAAAELEAAKPIEPKLKF